MISSDLIPCPLCGYIGVQNMDGVYSCLACHHQFNPNDHTYSATEIITVIH